MKVGEAFSNGVIKPGPIATSCAEEILTKSGALGPDSLTVSWSTFEFMLNDKLSPATPHARRRIKTVAAQRSTATDKILMK